MDVDSVHSTIERAARNVTVKAPSQYETIVQLARETKSYIVHLMATDFFHDFSSPEPVIKSKKGEVLKWMKIKRFRYVKDKIEFSYDYTGQMSEITILKPHRSAAVQFTNTVLAPPWWPFMINRGY